MKKSIENGMEKMIGKPVEELKESEKTTLANGISLAGITGMLAIAGFSLPVTLGFLSATVAGLTVLTIRENHKEGK